MTIRQLNESLIEIQKAISSLANPSSFDKYQFYINLFLAFSAVAAIIFAGISVRAAFLTVKVARESVARESVAREELREYGREFDKEEFFIRFWRLDMLTRDPENTKLGALRYDVYCSRDGHPVTKHSLGPSTRSALDKTAVEERALDYRKRIEKCESLSDIVFDALGPEISTRRADMYSLYLFALKLGAFCETCSPNGPDYLSQIFGSQLLVTFSRHRLLAYRLLPRSSSQHPYPDDYYARAYGLYDPIYTNLVDALFDSATERNLLDNIASKRISDINNFITSFYQKTAKSKST